MIIDLTKWNSYWGTSLGELPYGERVENITISLFNRLFPNIPKYEDIENENCITKYEQALMEQAQYFIDNDELLNGSVATGKVSESIEGYSYSLSKDFNITSNNDGIRISPNAYNYLEECGFTYMGIGGCK